MKGGECPSPPPLNETLTIQANLCCILHVSLEFGTKFTWIVVIKIFAINLLYHHSHFLATTLDFTPFFTMVFLGATHFFTAGLFLD